MKIWHFATPLQLFFVLNLPTIQIGHSITCTLGLKFNALVKAWKNDYIFWLIWIMNTKDNELSLSHSHAAQFKGADWLISNSAKFSYREGGAALQLYSTQCCLIAGKDNVMFKAGRSAMAVSSLRPPVLMLSTRCEVIIWWWDKQACQTMIFKEYLQGTQCHPPTRCGPKDSLADIEWEGRQWNLPLSVCSELCSELYSE